MRRWLVGLLIAGCGTSSSDPGDVVCVPDGIASDGIHVHVAHGGPQAGADVLFHDPAGALILSGKTDANGNFVGDVPDCSSATVISPGPFDPDARANTLGPIDTMYWTVTGAQRGDDLVFGNSNTPRISRKILVEAVAAPGNPTSYSLSSDCYNFAATSSAPPTTIDLACAGPTITIMATAGDAYFAELDDVPVAPGSTAKITAWTPMVPSKVTIINAPAASQSDLAIEYLRHGRVFYRHRFTQIANTQSFMAPVGGDEVRVTGRFQMAMGFSQTLTAHVTNLSDATIDFGSRAMPLPKARELLDVGAAVLRWSPDDGPMDVTILRLESSYPIEPLALHGLWLIVTSNHQPGALRLPVLPNVPVSAWDTVPFPMLVTSGRTYSSYRQDVFTQGLNVPGFEQRSD